MTKAREKKLRIDTAFISLFALLVAINVPFLLGVILPRHDTFSGFQTFYFFYTVRLRQEAG